MIKTIKHLSGNTVTPQAIKKPNGVIHIKVHSPLAETQIYKNKINN